MLTRYVLVSALMLGVATLAGCGEGFYSSTQTNNGVVIVNRFTGAAQRVEGHLLIPLHEQAPALPAVNRTLSPITVAKLPFTVSGNARYFEGKILARITILAKDAATRESGLKYLEYVRNSTVWSPSLTLQFVDARGFVLAKYETSFSEFIRTVNDKGEPVEYTNQVELPMQREGYTEVIDWHVLWAGWPTWNADSK